MLISVSGLDDSEPIQLLDSGEVYLISDSAE